MARSHGLARFFGRLAALLLAALVVAACQPTPSYLRRWANTEGSEEKFLQYLHDPELPTEVRVTALELLLEQWSYAYSMLVEGKALKDIEDTAARDEILQGALPRLKSRYAEGESYEIEMRDAAFNLRAATTNPAILAELDGVLHDWITTKWDPCRIGSGTVRVGQILDVLGPEVGGAKVAEIVREGAFDRVLCFGRDVTDLAWAKTSDLVAQAYIDRWNSGNMDANTQLRFEYLEQALRSNAAPVMRRWIFEQLNSSETDALFKNAMLDAIADNPTAADSDGYRQLLANETNGRWAAFQALVDAGGSDGLEAALSGLPATGEYGFYRDAIVPDGLKQVTSSFLCTLTKLTELGDNARVVFERHIQDENLYSRLISISCLAVYGDAQSVQRLSEAKRALGGPVPAPSYGEGATVQSVIDATTAAIEARLAAPQQ